MRSAIAALSIGIYKVVQPGLDQLAEVEGLAVANCGKYVQDKAFKCKGSIFRIWPTRSDAS